MVGRLGIDNVQYILNDLLGFILMVSFFLWAFSILGFARISVRYIEKKMEESGVLLPHWDDGMGLRIAMYAITVARGKTHKDSFIDTESIVCYARTKDRYLAIFSLIATIFMLVVGAVLFLSSR
jgi:hypothetical protein